MCRILIKGCSPPTCPWAAVALSHLISEWCHPLLPLSLSSLQPKMDTQLPATFPSPPQKKILGDLSKNIYDHITPLFQTFRGSHCYSDNVKTPDGRVKDPPVPLASLQILFQATLLSSESLACGFLSFPSCIRPFAHALPQPSALLASPCCLQHPPSHPAAPLPSQPAPISRPDPFLRAPRRLQWTLQ